jgi:hypothetical protein
MSSLTRTSSCKLFHCVFTTRPSHQMLMNTYVILYGATDPMASRHCHLPYATYMRAARTQSPSQLRYIVSTFPFFYPIWHPYMSLLTLLYTPKLDAHNVCEHAKNHYDVQQGQRLFDSEIASETSAGSTASGPDHEYRLGFRRTHECMARTMYFC